ncbi:Re/Si-specific NAD(P)(+) transhydrogenase subunit alpha [soil metagenome]
MDIGCVKESAAGERRVALTPDAIKKLVAAGHRVTVERGAGIEAGFSDSSYETAGAVISDVQTSPRSEVVVAVNSPDPASLQQSTLIGLLRPLEEPETMVALSKKGVSAIAFELIPRTTRAQAMDALSSQATAAGYQAALEAARLCNRFFPMLTTAAGTIPPAKALVLGAGVAGLQAIATCRRLGAAVSGFDVRSAAAEQVRSLGAAFVDVGVATQDSAPSGGYARELEAEAERRVLEGLAGQVQAADVVISTAAIPGRPAPLLITKAMVESMKPGSVIIDLAASTGGNCELTKPGEIVEHRGVKIIGHTDFASRKPYDSSQMYARNVIALLGLLGAHGELDFSDDILDAATVTHAGEVRNERVRG